MKTTFSLIAKAICTGIVFLTGFTSKAQTTVVGAVAGTAEVSATGAFTYTIPLSLPPGIKGMMPQLAINYNSQQQAGIMGVGWNISGLSSITRTTSNIHYNAAVDPVDFDANDVYVLDGQRLVQEGPVSGGATPYLTSVQNFHKIASYGQAGNGPEWFRVETPDGVVFEYGSTADSRMEASGRADVLMWGLAKVYDKCGNYMEFHYYDDNTWGEYRIAYIDYTGNSSVPVTPQTRIWFNYEYKPDKNVSWVSGSRLQDVWRVSDIQIRNLSDNSLLHKYEFGYAVDFYTHLTSIKETGQNGEALPVLQINWGSASPQRNIITQPFNADAYEYSIGDFNGDGLMDIIRIPSYISGGPVFEFYKSNVNGTYTFVSATLFPIISGFLKKYNPAGFNLNNKMVFDYNGDGKDDYLVMNYDDQRKSVYVSIYISDGTNFSRLNNSFAFFYLSATPGFTDKVKFLPGDFDGDGKKELIIAVPEYTSGIFVGYNCYLIGDEYPAYPSAHSFFLPGESLHMFARDFDGDGRDDIHRTINGTPSFQVSGLNVSYDPLTRKPYLTSPIMPVPLSSSGYPTQWHRIYPGDFNGDGKTDLLTWTDYSGGRWEIAYSKGNDYDVRSLEGLQQTTDPDLDLTSYNYVVADFNGDGKDDIMEVLGHNISTDSWPYKVWYSQGNHVFIPEADVMTASEVGTWHQGSLQPTDMNGDGQADLLMKTQYYEPLRCLFFHKNDQRHLVQSIDNGSGYSISANYALLPQYAEYTSAPSAYPFTTTTLPLKIVTALYDNKGGLSNSYSYSGLTLHRGGLGLRGFNQYTVRDWVGNKSTVLSFNTKQYQSVLPESSKTFASASNQNTVITEVSNSYVQYSFAGSGIENTYIIAPDIINSRDNSSGSSKQTQYLYYAGGEQSLFPYGKADAILENTGNGQEMSFIEMEYNDNDAYVYNRSKPRKITTLVQRAGKPTYTRSTEYSYNGQSQVYTITSDPSTPDSKTRYYIYDDFGNVVQDISHIPSLVTWTAGQFQYSSDGRFLTRSQNVYNYQELYTYNLWGSPLTHTDINGLTTSYEYDGFNRLKKTTGPTGISTTCSYSLASGEPDQPSHHTSWYYTTSQTGGINNPNKTFYDHYGRLIRKSYLGFGGQTVYEDIKYKPGGLPDWHTAPYYSGSSGITTSFSYDAMDREVSRSVSGGGASYTTQYNLLTFPTYNKGLEVTSTNTATGQAKITETDATGKIVKVTEGSGSSLIYSYNSNGQPDQIGVNILSGTPTVFIYDAFGNRTSIHTPNTGTISYTYDALGRLITQTDANNKTFSYSYDLLDRLVHKNGPDGNYVYTYDNGTSLQALGKLVSVQSPYSTKKTYRYDTYSRLDRLEDWIDFESFVSEYTYDAYDRLVNHTYPTGDVVQNTYNGYGYQTGVRIPTPPNSYVDNVLYRITEQDALGNTLSAEYQPYGGPALPGGAPVPPPLLSLSEPHTAHGFLTASDLYHNGTSAYLSRYDYTFDPQTGNLSSRKDVLRNIPETFQYDQYDRLYQVNGNSSSQQTIKYDVLGNIEGKTDMAPIPAPGPTVPLSVSYNVTAITSIPNPNIPTIPDVTQTVSYTPFNKVKRIYEGSKALNFTYGADDQRIRMEYFGYGNGAFDKVLYYSQDYEKTVIAGYATFHAGYVYVGDRLVAILSKEASSPTDVYYVHTDYLGSVTGIMDAGGQFIEERSYDVWGRRRDPVSWIPYNNTNTPITLFEHGFTGHEHLPDFGIINMNGRVYDPVMGRMFSPDPYVADATNLQTYNRYSYAVNNPLKYTDPTGENPLLIAAAVGAGISALGYTAHIATSSGGFENWDWGQFSISTIMGGFSGIMSFGIGSAFGSLGSQLGGSVLLNEAARAGTHGLSGYIMSGGQSNAFLSSAFGSAAGSFGGFIGGPLNTTIGGIAFTAGVGGTASLIGGGSFWEGAASAASVHLTNQVIHQSLAKELKKVYDNYPTDGDEEISAGEAFNRVNDAAHRLYLEQDPQYRNACATRLSLAFAAAGVKIPSGYGGLKDRSGNRIITSAIQMERFLSSRYGFMRTNYNSGMSKNGIYVGLTKPGYGYSGHVTIIRPGFNFSTYEASMRAMYFWNIK